MLLTTGAATTVIFADDVALTCCIRTILPAYQVCVVTDEAPQRGGPRRIRVEHSIVRNRAVELLGLVAASRADIFADTSGNLEESLSLRLGKQVENSPGLTDENAIDVIMVEINLSRRC